MLPQHDDDEEEEEEEEDKDADGDEEEKLTEDAYNTTDLLLSKFYYHNSTRNVGLFTLM